MTDNPDTDTDTDATESIAQLRQSFFYGSRSNLNFKFLKDLSDAEFGDFLVELLGAVAGATDTGDATDVVDVAYRWQVEAYRGHLGDPSSFPHRHEDTPWASMTKPLAESRVAVLTSSGHFLDGDDPMPLGIEGMTQAEAEARIKETIKEPPSLSAIPSDAPFDKVQVRHGGYPVAAAQSDPQVVLPLRLMEQLQAEGVIGQNHHTAYSFVGAAAQGPIKKRIGPEWAERLRDEEVDAVLLVPI